MAASKSERDRKIYSVADFEDGFEYEVYDHDCSRLLDLFQSQVKSQERVTRISLPILRLVFDKGRAYLPKSETNYLYKPATTLARSVLWPVAISKSGQRKMTSLQTQAGEIPGW